MTPMIPLTRIAAGGRAALVFVVLAATLTGCRAPHPGVSNGSVSACYRAIPAGRAALHAQSATVIGVHRIAADRVRSQLPPSAQALLAADNDTTVCVVSFKGSFTAGQVDLAPPTDQGKYAVVLVTSHRLHVIASAVLDHLPGLLGGRVL